MSMWVGAARKELLKIYADFSCLIWQSTDKCGLLADEGEVGGKATFQERSKINFRNFSASCYVTCL
jgi:hypothetical protein